MFAPLLPVLPHIKASKLRALGLMNDGRSDLLPGVRSLAEQGVPGFNYSSGYGLVAQVATPAAIVNRLSETPVSREREMPARCYLLSCKGAGEGAGSKSTA